MTGAFPEWSYDAKLVWVVPGADEVKVIVRKSPEQWTQPFVQRMEVLRPLRSVTMRNASVLLPPVGGTVVRRVVLDDGRVVYTNAATAIPNERPRVVVVEVPAVAPPEGTPAARARWA